MALAASPVRGETADKYAGSNFAFIDAAKTWEAAASITPAKYPDSDSATVDHKTVQVYRADGTGESQDEAFIKVLTEKGKKAYASISTSFMLPYSTAEVVKMEIMKPDGKIVAVDVAANSKETIESGQMEMNIYDPNSKVIVTNIPGLETGDVLHWITRTTTQRSIIPGEFADENVFEADGYIRHMTYEVHAPADKPLKKIVLRDEVPGTVKYTAQPGEDQTTVHRWEVTNVPRMFNEASMPPYENVLQRVVVSTTPDWRAISKWYWELSKPHLETATPELKKTVADLTAGAKSDMDRVKALFYFVSQKIRYMGLTPEKDRPGFEPHDVCLTFDKKYGVCRDKAALLVAMLREAGLNAYPVLVNVGSKKDKEVPDPGFNHAIVGVELNKGEYTLMDPTDEHTRELLPTYDGNQSYLVARPEGETVLTSAVESPEKNMMAIKTTGTLTSSGGLVAKSELALNGIYDNIVRNSFSMLKADDLRRGCETLLKKSLPGAKLVSLKVTPENMQDMSTPVKITIEYSVDDVTVSGHGKSVVKVPWLSSGVSIFNMILGEAAGLDQRKYPLLTQVTCGTDEQISLKLGEGFSGAFSMPVCEPVENDCLSYHRSFSMENGMLECSRSLKLKAVEFSPEQYAQLKKTLKEMAYDDRKSPVLNVPDHAGTVPEVATQPPAPAAVDSNATILNSHKEIEVTDAHTATYRVKYSVRILTYAGKKQYADVEIPYNPACQEVRFIRGTVISKTGQSREISKTEMNTMDAEWSASAKRYTGGKIFVANLPGVDIGSTIDVEYEIATKGRPFIGGFEPFQFVNDLDQKSLQLTAPAGVKIEKMTTGSGPILATAPVADGGKQIYQWVTEKMPALPGEMECPPAWFYTPGVAYFAGDLKAGLRALNDQMLDRSRSRTKVEALVRQLTKESKSKLETVKTIRDYVAKSIRVAGPASFMELPLSELSAADTTLEDGYGHAADRAILLHAMLSAAGFHPEFVMGSNLPALEDIRKVATSFPMPESFEIPLVKLTLDGTTYYLNDTDQYARLGSTGHDDRLGIDLSNQGYEVIKAARDCADRIETAYTLSFDKQGRMEMKVSKHYFGGEYNKMNRFFSELLPEERKRYYQAAISKVGQGARAMGDLTDHFGTYPGTEEFKVELDNYAVMDGNYIYFSLPFTPALFQLPGGDQRSLPFILSQEATSSVRAEIEFPAGFHDVIISPGSEDVNAPDGGGKAQLSASSKAGKFVMTGDFEKSPAIINAKDYPAMQKMESALERSGKVFLLQKDDVSRQVN